MQIDNCSFNLMPREIMVSIFEKLDDPSWKESRRVCKVWHQILTSAYFSTKLEPLLFGNIPFAKKKAVALILHSSNNRDVKLLKTQTLPALLDGPKLHYFLNGTVHTKAVSRHYCGYSNLEKGHVFQDLGDNQRLFWSDKSPDEVFKISLETNDTSYPGAFTTKQFGPYKISRVFHQLEFRLECSNGDKQYYFDYVHLFDNFMRIRQFDIEICDVQLTTHSIYALIRRTNNCFESLCSKHAYSYAIAAFPIILQ